ncbi:MAG: 30S ribosomal protein S6 [Nitrospinae bacterium]|nr:30S ribosomal protein S6 [Nitrospinota bacterium]
MRSYESIFVLKPDLNDNKVDGQVERVKEFIEKNGGKIIVIEKWGKKKLAYLIKKNRFGIYVLIHFESAPGLVSLLQRNYKLNEDIIRYMTVIHQEMTPRAQPSGEGTESALSLIHEGSEQNSEGLKGTEEDSIEDVI